MTRKMITGVAMVMVCTFAMIISAIVPTKSPANATSGNAIFSGEQPGGQVSVNQTGQKVTISDEYALQKIEQIFGPAIAARAKHRVSEDTLSNLDESSLGTFTELSNNHCVGTM